MYRAREAVTLVHLVQGTGAAADSYTCTTVVGSWYRQNRATVTDNGLKAAQIVKCRVPSGGLSADALAAVLALTQGDKIVRGTVSDVDGAAFAALGRTAEAAVLLDIHDNRTGPHPHFYLEGAG